MLQANLSSRIYAEVKSVVNKICSSVLGEHYYVNGSSFLFFYLFFFLVFSDECRQQILSQPVSKTHAIE